jgi:hypothetical protein
MAAPPSPAPRCPVRPIPSRSAEPVAAEVEPSPRSRMSAKLEGRASLPLLPSAPPARRSNWPVGAPLSRACVDRRWRARAAAPLAPRPAPERPPSSSLSVSSSSSSSANVSIDCSLSKPPRRAASLLAPPALRAGTGLPLRLPAAPPLARAEGARAALGSELSAGSPVERLEGGAEARSASCSRGNALDDTPAAALPPFVTRAVEPLGRPVPRGLGAAEATRDCSIRDRVSRLMGACHKPPPASGSVPLPPARGCPDESDDDGLRECAKDVARRTRCCCCCCCCSGAATLSAADAADPAARPAARACGRAPAVRGRADWLSSRSPGADERARAAADAAHCCWRVGVAIPGDAKPGLAAALLPALLPALELGVVRASSGPLLDVLCAPAVTGAPAAPA